MSSGLLLHVREGFLHVLRRPLRSALTAVTSAVAIAVTVNVVSLNYGMDEDIRRDVRRFGVHTVDVGRAPVLAPGAPPVAFGDAELARVREAVRGLDAVVVPTRLRSGSVAGDAVVPRVAVAAVPTDFPRTLDLSLRAGRFLGKDDAGWASCVVDESLAKALFPGVPVEQVVGRSIRVRGDFEGDPRPVVVGILEDPMTYRALFEAFDEGRSTRSLATVMLLFRNVYVPADAVPGAELSGINVVLPDAARVDEATRRLGRIWPQVDPDDAAATLAPIRVLRRRDWMEAMGGTTQAGAFLGNIVWILIVLVACVMVSTLNLIAVRERYDEIAVRRCEGARKRHLVAQIAGESVLTSVAGGVLGLPLGYLGAALLRRIVDFPFRFEIRYAGLALVVALVLGLLSSWIPARRAAGLDPARVLSRRLT